MSHAIENLQKMRQAGVPLAQAEAIAAVVDARAEAERGEARHELVDHKSEIARILTRFERAQTESAKRMDAVVERLDKAHAEHVAKMDKLREGSECQADNAARRRKLSAMCREMDLLIGLSVCPVGIGFGLLMYMLFAMGTQ